MKNKLTGGFNSIKLFLEKLAYDDGFRFSLESHPELTLKQEGIEIGVSKPIKQVILPSKPVLRAILNCYFSEPPEEDDGGKFDLFNLFIFTNGNRKCAIVNNS